MDNPVKRHTAFALSFVESACSSQLVILASNVPVKNSWRSLGTDARLTMVRGGAKTATGQHTVPDGLEQLDTPSSAPSSESVSAHQEGVARGT